MSGINDLAPAMSDAEIARIHRRERALWRRYMSRYARCPAAPMRTMTELRRCLHAVAAIAEARREWKGAHDALEAARLQRAPRWGAEAQGMEAQGAAC